MVCVVGSLFTTARPSWGLLPADLAGAAAAAQLSQTGGQGEPFHREVQPCWSGRLLSGSRGDERGGGGLRACVGCKCAGLSERSQLSSRPEVVLLSTGVCPPLPHPSAQVLGPAPAGEGGQGRGQAASVVSPGPWAVAVGQRFRTQPPAWSWARSSQADSMEQGGSHPTCCPTGRGSSDQRWA